MSDSQGTHSSRAKVGIAELKVLRAPFTEVVTFALGSCIGVSTYDPVAKVGGLLHYMLPAPGRETCDLEPARFGMTGIPELFRDMYQMGASKSNIVVCAAGGGSMLEGDSRVGDRNRAVLRKLLWKNGVALTAVDTGGSHSRTMGLNLVTGEVWIESMGQRKRLYPLKQE